MVLPGEMCLFSLFFFCGRQKPSGRNPPPITCARLVRPCAPDAGYTLSDEGGPPVLSHGGGSSDIFNPVCPGLPSGTADGAGTEIGHLRQAAAGNAWTSRVWIGGGGVSESELENVPAYRSLRRVSRHALCLPACTFSSSDVVKMAAKNHISHLPSRVSADSLTRRMRTSKTVVPYMRRRSRFFVICHGSSWGMCRFSDQTGTDHCLDYDRISVRTRICTSYKTYEPPDRHGGEA